MADNVNVKQWVETIGEDAAVGAAHGAVVTMVIGGGDLGLHTALGAVVGAAIGLVRYPLVIAIRRLRRKQR